MKPSRLERWLQHIFETPEVELSCLELSELIAQYVDREIAGEAVAETMPHVKRALGLCRDQCRACYETYEVLVSLARLEKAVPPVDDLTKLP